MKINSHENYIACFYTFACTMTKEEIIPLKEWRKKAEEDYIKEVYFLYNKNMSKTANALGVDRKTLYNKIGHLFTRRDLIENKK